MLLIDAEDRSRAVHRELLESLGWRTTDWSAADALLQHLAQETFDSSVRHVIVIVGRIAPTEAVWEDVEQVTRVAESLGYPLVLLLPTEQHDYSTQIARSHVAQFLIKPVKPQELHSVLTDVLGIQDDRATGRPLATDARVQRSRSVLLAEDCLVNQEVAVGLLELLGHSVRVVNNGREAVEAARQQNFDVVLMDVEMPELDGLEATRLIRDMEVDTGRRTPIVAMTAHAVTGFQQKCLEAGMDDYISKPIDPQKLSRIMEGVSSPSGCAT